VASAFLQGAAFFRQAAIRQASWPDDFNLNLAGPMEMRCNAESSFVNSRHGCDPGFDGRHPPGRRSTWMNLAAS